jgi:hypothetical protein
VPFAKLDAVVLGRRHGENRLDQCDNRRFVVAGVLHGEVDVTGRPAVAERREEHAAFQHELLAYGTLRETG